MKGFQGKDVDLPSLNGISFCTGIGGIELGLKRALAERYRTVCYVEGETHAAAVLAARMQDGALCNAPIWSDVKTFDPHPWRGIVDLISAGYPCQPFSAAGKRKGADDARHLWPYILQHIATIRPSIVFCENVEGHLSLGFEEVSKGLQQLGYGIEAGLFSAVESGAPHVRKRLFFIAYADSSNIWHAKSLDGPSGLQAELGNHGSQEHMAHASGQRFERGRKQGKPKAQICAFKGESANVADPHKLCGRPGQESSAVSSSNAANSGVDVANTNSVGCIERGARSILYKRGIRSYSGSDRYEKSESWWQTEPAVGRVVDGLPQRVDRLRALGNAVVPAVAENAWRHLTARIANSNASF